MIIDLTQLKKKSLAPPRIDRHMIAKAMYMAPETIREVLINGFADKMEGPTRGSKFMIDDIPNTGALSTKQEIADIQRQLAATANDPNLTIVSADHWYHIPVGKPSSVGKDSNSH